MKKLLVFSFAICLAFGMTACGNKAQQGAGNDSTATETQTEAQAAPAKKVDVKEVIAKAKAEGANWNEAQWKSAFEDMFTGLDPMFQILRDMEAKTKAAKTDEEKAAVALEMLGSMEKMEKEMKPLEEAMKEFEKIVEANPVAKKLSDDEAFQAEMKKKFNLPDDM